MPYVQICSPFSTLIFLKAFCCLSPWKSLKNGKIPASVERMRQVPHPVSSLTHSLRAYVHFFMLHVCVKVVPGVVKILLEFSHQIQSVQTEPTEAEWGRGQKADLKQQQQRGGRGCRISLLPCAHVQYYLYISFRGVVVVVDQRSHYGLEIERHSTVKTSRKQSSSSSSGPILLLSLILTCWSVLRRFLCSLCSFPFPATNIRLRHPLLSIPRLCCTYRRTSIYPYSYSCFPIRNLLCLFPAPTKRFIRFRGLPPPPPSSSFFGSFFPISSLAPSVCLSYRRIHVCTYIHICRHSCICTCIGEWTQRFAFTLE